MKRPILALVLLAVISSAAVWPRATARVPDARGSWTRAASMPTARSEMPAAVLDGRIYVPGGIGSFGRTVAAFEAYDPLEGVWTRLEPLPVGVHHAGVASAAGRLYLMGGYTDLNFSVDNGRVWAYDPGSDVWAHVSDMPSPRAAHVLVSVEDTIYVVGGVGPDARALWAYNPVANSWTIDLSPLPTAREHLTAVAVGGLIYAIAGRWQGRGNLGTVEIYDPETDAWTPGPNLPTPRGGLAAAVVNGRIHVGGGEELSTGRTFDTHEIYDPETGAWETGVPMVAPRHGLASAGLDDSWFVIGGATRAGVQTVASLTDTVDVLDVGNTRRVPSE